MTGVQTCALPIYASIWAIDRTDTAKGVPLTDIILCSTEDAADHLDLFKTQCKHVVIYDKDGSVSVVDGDSPHVDMSDMFVSSLNYTMPIDGNETESIYLEEGKRWLGPKHDDPDIEDIKEALEIENEDEDEESGTSA